MYSPGQDLNHHTNPSWEWRSFAVTIRRPANLRRSINKIDIYGNRLPHKYEQYWTAWYSPRGYIMQSKTVVLRLIPDKGRHCHFSLQWEVLATIFLCIYLAGMNHACVRKKTNKITLNVSQCNAFGENFKFGNCFTTVWRLEIFCWGDMKKNLIKGRSLESVWTVLTLTNFFPDLKTAF